MNNKTNIKIIIVFLVVVSIMGTDFFLPSLPSMKLNLCTNNTAIQSTISVYFFSLALSQLVYGPLSDIFGRRIFVVIGSFIAIIGTIICIFAPSVSILIFGRIMQGIGLGAYRGLARAIALDVFKGKNFVIINSYISTLAPIIITLAPIIGSYFHELHGWRFVFVFFLIILLIVFIFIYNFLFETNNHQRIKPKNIFCILNSYINIFIDRKFFGYLICSSLSLAGISAFITVAPFLFQEILKLTPIEFGWLSIFVAGGIAIGSYINSKIIKKSDILTMVKVGSFLMLLGGTIMWTIGIFGIINVSAITIPYLIFSTGCGIILPSASAGALEKFHKSAGIANTLFSSFQILISALSSAFIAVMPETNQILLSLLCISIGGISYLAIQILIKNK